MEGKLPKEVLSKASEGAEPTTVDLQTAVSNAKVIALYFSANWCGSCKSFTPQLAKLYNEVNKDGKQLEVIFVSGDEEEEDFNSYYKHMPWLAIPFEQEDERADIGEGYKAASVPYIVLIDKNGKVKKDKANQDIMVKGALTDKPLSEVFESWKAVY